MALLYWPSSLDRRGRIDQSYSLSDHVYCPHRNPLRRSHSFALRDGVKVTFMSRGSQPNLVSYVDDDADQASSSRDDSRKKGGHMRNVSAQLCTPP